MMNVVAVPPAHGTPVTLTRQDARDIRAALSEQAILTPLNQPLAAIEGRSGSIPAYVPGVNVLFPQPEVRVADD